MGREKTIDPDRVAIYIRWSTDDQSDGTTLEVQLDGCRHYVLSQGWIVNEDLIFIDDGYSGGTLERPALSRLRTMVKGGQIECVVVFKLDRLSRSVIDMVNLVLEEWDGLTHVKSAREPVDTSSAMGKQFFYMLVSFAEWERNVIRERMTAGRRARAREGYKPSAVAPFGYRHGAAKGGFSIDETEAPVVRKIFELYVQGLGAKAILTRLNEEGFRNREGEMWNERTILYMLSNPTYVGKMVYGRVSRNPRHGKAEGERYWTKNEQVLEVEKSPFIPPIIGEDLFALVQEIKAKRRLDVRAQAPRAVSSPHLLTGLAKCRCGYSLYAKVQRRGDREYRYYACLGKKIKGKVHCSSGSIARDLLDREVEQQLLARYGDRVARENYRATVLADLERELSEVAAVMAQVQQRLDRLEGQEKKVRLDYREQIITAAEFRALRKDLMEEIGQVRTQKQQLIGRRMELEQQAEALSSRLRVMGRMDQWSELEPHERKNLVRCFVDSMVAWVDEPRGEVHLHLQWHGSGH